MYGVRYQLNVVKLSWIGGMTEVDILAQEIDLSPPARSEQLPLAAYLQDRPKVTYSTLR